MKAFLWESAPTEEDRLFRKFLCLSVACHVVFFVADRFDFWTSEPTMVDEWSMETDLISPDEFGQIKETSLPKAKESNEVKVPETLLPQLPQNFKVEEAKKADEEEGLTADKDAKDIGEVKNDQVKTAPKTDLNKDASNKVAMADALKRLALEKLRKDKQTTKKDFTAQKSDTMARLRQELNANSIAEGMSGGGMGSTQKAYVGKVQSIVRKNWSYPSMVQWQVAKPKALVKIVLLEDGNLKDVRIEQSSGDTLFDDYTVRAVKASTPFPTPPDESLRVLKFIFSEPGAS